MSNLTNSPDKKGTTQYVIISYECLGIKLELGLFKEAAAAMVNCFIAPWSYCCSKQKAIEVIM